MVGERGRELGGRVARRGSVGIASCSVFLGLVAVRSVMCCKIVVLLGLCC